MNAPTRIGAFLVGLAAVFALALGLGSLVGPVGEPAAASPDTGHDASHDTGHEHDAAPDPGHGEGQVDAPGAVGLPGGLTVSEGGYTLRLARGRLPAGTSTGVDFTIEGPDGEPVTAYDEIHTKQLHLVAVRRDFGGFQHVHPALYPDGAWSVPVDLTPGSWRIFADFKPAGAEAVTLGADLSVTGEATRATRSAIEQPVTRTAKAGPYAVTLTGDLTAGAHSGIEFELTRRGKPVTDLQPYLGAYGHLVALREGDLAYLHVHPDGEPGDGETSPGPAIGFSAEVPSAGRYHLYLDFRHRGVVRTARFVLDAAPDEATSSSD